MHAIILHPSSLIYPTSLIAKVAESKWSEWETNKLFKHENSRLIRHTQDDNDEEEEKRRKLMSLKWRCIPNFSLIHVVVWLLLKFQLFSSDSMADKLITLSSKKVWKCKWHRFHFSWIMKLEIFVRVSQNKILITSTHQLVRSEKILNFNFVAIFILYTSEAKCRWQFEFSLASSSSPN